MPFPIKPTYIVEAEKEAEFRFPEIFKFKMQRENGGEFFAEDEYWELFPFFDKSDKKRVKRTCNHIILETEKAKKWNNFPRNVFAIGKNGCGDLLILAELKPNELGEKIYIWRHESGEITQVGNDINDFKVP